MLQATQRTETNGLTEGETSVFALRHGTRANLRSHAGSAAGQGAAVESQRAWQLQIESLLDDAEQSRDRRLRVDTLHRAALIYEQQLGDMESAFIVMQAALSEEPGRCDTKKRLEHLASSTDQWDELLASSTELASELELDAPDHAAELWLDIAGWQHDRSARGEAYRRVLLLRGDDPDALEALAAAHESAEEWEPAIELLGRLADTIHSTARRVDINHRVGRILCGYLHDNERAEPFFLHALALDPAHIASIEDLAEVYRARGDWKRATDSLLRSDKGAISASRKLRLIRAAADIYRDEQQWSELEPVLELLLRRTELCEPRVIAALHNQLGHVRLKLGKRRAALVGFEAALDAAPGHRDSMRQVADLYATFGNWEHVAMSLRALTDGADDGERSRILDELAGIYWHKLDRPDLARSCCDEALRQDPADHRVLQKLLDLHVEEGRWSGALEILERFAGIESNSLHRGKYLQTAGAICRDELGAPRRAVDYFEQALDCFFEDTTDISRERQLSLMSPFADIDAILTRLDDAPGREAAYLRMISRLQTDDPILPHVLDALGGVYRTCFGDSAKAIGAYEAAVELEPACAKRRAIVADLHMLAGPSSADKAVAQHAAILANDPQHASSYRALRTIYTDSGQYDKAWCVCAALTYLDRATIEERRYHKTYKSRFLVKSTQRLVGGIWYRIQHPLEDRRIGAILGSIARDVALMRSQSHKHYGLNRKKRRDTDGDQLALTRVLNYVSKVLDVALPDIYLQPDEPGELLLANTSDRRCLVPAMVARGDALRGRSGRELAYLAGRSLSLLRTEHLVKLAYPDIAELQATLDAAVALARSSVPMGHGLTPAAEQMLSSLQAALSPSARERLIEVVARSTKGDDDLDVTAWAGAVDLTAQRAAFILCGDLRVAARAIAREAVPAGGMAPAAKLDELLLYSVSEDYFAVRKYLGATIDQIARATQRLKSAA